MYTHMYSENMTDGYKIISLRLNNKVTIKELMLIRHVKCAENKAAKKMT